MRNILPGILLIVIGAIIGVLYQQSNPRNVASQKLISPLPVLAYSPSPTPTPSIDPRIEKVERFLKKYNSPMASEAKTFVIAGDVFKIDYKLLVAMAGVESTFGKHTPSCAPFNPFGWKSYSSPCGFYRFQDFKESINHVAQRISSMPVYGQFRESGSLTELQQIYNGEEGSWTKNIIFFIEKLK